MVFFLVLLATRILRVLEDGPRARRILEFYAQSLGKGYEFEVVFAALVAAGRIRSYGGRKGRTYGLPNVSKLRNSPRR